MHSKSFPLTAVLLATFVLAACGTAPSATAVPATVPAVVQTDLADTPIPDPTATTTTTAVAGGVSFSVDILPLLQSRCGGCHGGQRTEEGLNLRSYEAVMAGSEHGAVIIPGDAANSKLATLVAEGEMPKRGPKLTPVQVQLVIDWINAGALNN